MPHLLVTYPPCDPPRPACALHLPTGSGVGDAVDAALARIGEQSCTEKERERETLCAASAPGTHPVALA